MRKDNEQRCLSSQTEENKKWNNEKRGEHREKKEKIEENKEKNES